MSDRGPGDGRSDARMRRIWAAVCDIPPGRVASYGQVAEMAGIARGARQVGHALKNVPGELSIPWYRVLRSSGHLAFASGSAAFRLQAKCLADEGVVVSRGRVAMNKYRWQPDLDELLWKPSAAWDERQEDVG